MRKRTIIAGTFVAMLIAFGLSAKLAANDEAGRNYVWPHPHPVFDPRCANQSLDPSRELTLLMRPVRVDLDERAPGVAGVRAVRLHLRGLHNSDEETVAFERPLFASDGEMASFQRKLARFMNSPIFSIHFRGTPDDDSPSYNHRWRADRLPDWMEVPLY